MNQTAAPSFPTPTTAQDCVAISAEVRKVLAATSDQVDRAGVYPTANMDLIDDSGLGLLTLPRSEGGLISAEPLDDFAAIMEVVTNIAAGESSTAQMWLFNRMAAYELTAPASPLSFEARRQLIREIRDGHVRFCEPNNEHSSVFGQYTMEILRVPGGVQVSGTKYFATGSAGAKYAVSIGVTKGFDDIPDGTLHRVVVDLTDPGVTIVGDWDNMGQRSTGSGALIYDSVFVSDGFHWSIADFEWTRYPTVGLGITALVLGIGLGALDAVLDFVTNKAAFKGATEDRVIRHYLGRFSASLAAAQALFRTAVDIAVDAERTMDEDLLANASAVAEQAKVAVVDAALYVSGEMHRLCGGQSTANEYDLDRFWRNARTLSVQNVLDLGIDRIAGYALSTAK